MFRISAPGTRLRALGLTLLPLFLSGCGGVPAEDLPKNETPGGNTLNSSVEDPDWGKFELLATGEDADTGEWNFVVHTSRAVAKDQLRFVWDFGNGPEGEGLEQSHAFAENGTHFVTVTAYGLDDAIAFVLKLSIKVDATANKPPHAVITAEEFVAENELVFLYGGSSSDPNQDELTFQWTQIGGTPVQIIDPSEPSASFVSPLVDKDEELSFRLIVSDGELSGSSDVTIVVSTLLDPSELPEDELDPDTDGDGIADKDDECPNHPGQIVAGACGCGEEDRPDCPARVNCIASTSEWRNLTLTPQTGSFEIQFSATPKSNNLDAIVGLSSSMASTFSASAILIRFSPAGIIDVRNGGGYAADTTLPYSAEVQYSFRVIVNVPEHRYTVFARVQDDSEFRLATNFAFRTEQNAVSSLGFWNLWSDVGTTINLCGLRLSPTFLTVDAGNEATISPGGATSLNAVAIGGQGPYSYRWSPSTGLNNANIANPIAAPTTTTTYSVTATDLWGAIAIDSVTVNVRTPALTANAGADKEILAGGSTQLAGSAAGGTPPYTFKWSPAAGLNNANVAAPTASPSATTTYVMTVTDALGAVATDSVLITIRASSLIVNAGADKEISAGASTQLSGSATGGTVPYTFRWSPTTGLSNANVAAPMANPPTTTTYTLTVTDSNGATGTDTVTISIRSATLLANAGPDKTINLGESTVLQGSATGGTLPYLYRWAPSTGLSNANIASPTANPSVTTSYTLVVIDNSGASSSDRVVITVASTPTTGAFVVSGSAANASDSNPGTEALPWKTLAKAAATARAGQTVLVKEGNYDESIRPAYSGLAGSPIIFRAYPGHECQGGAGQPKTADSCKVDLTRTVELGGRNYIRIEGFEIRNTSGPGVRNTVSWYASSWQSVGNAVVNNFIHDTSADGIDSQNSSGLLVENNEIFNTGLSGVRFGGQMSSENLTARANNLHRIGKDGFQGGCNNCVFELNEMYDSVHTDQHQDAFDVGWITNSIIRYNRISDFTQLIYGGADSGSTQPWENLQIYGNVLFNNKYWSEQASEAPGIWIDQRVGSGATRNIVIHSNTFGWLGYGAIWIEGGGNPVTGIKVFNNIFYQAGIDVSGGGITSDYNLFYGMNKPAFEGSRSIVDNPQFMNYSGQGSRNFDFRLRSTSPCINKGAPDLGTRVTLPSDFRDLNGQSRPVGGGFDVGAYEGG